MTGERKSVPFGNNSPKHPTEGGEMTDRSITDTFDGKSEKLFNNSSG